MASFSLKDEDIYLWYGYITDSRKKNISGKRYCDENHLNYKKFCNMKQRFEYKKFSNPKSYEKLHVAATESIKNGIKNGDVKSICSKYDIEASHLSEMRTHLRYLEVINRIKLNLDKSPPVNEEMTFRQVISSSPVVIPEPEVIQAKNDIELTITKGVRVICSPNLDSMKLIKIIELLKDL